MISILSVIAIVYGAFVAMAQTDFKKPHRLLVGEPHGLRDAGSRERVTATGINGAMYMMLAHGTISAMLFMIVGVIYDRAHHRDIERFGGLAWVMPKFFVLGSIAMFASLGLPGFSGFIAEIMTFVGAFNGPHRLWAIISLLGLVVTAAYYLRTLQKVYLGETPEVYKDKAAYPDLSRRELAILVPLALVTVYMGILPNTVKDIYAPFVESVLVPLIEAAGGGAGS